jgi:AraC family transcriptional regulator, regulatory protein of adaptative response / methylated-DNA-[protein]-cysteine methyltransferase
MSQDIDEARWAQVVARDKDARFLISVKTTGVYCRPGCPSRLPLRRNIAFHDDIAAARAAGLRACKRCRPDETFKP